MNVRQYRIVHISDDKRKEKICWLDRLDLSVGDRVTLDSYPDSMWWTVEEVFDTVTESEQITLIRKPKEEYISFGWIPM